VTCNVSFTRVGSLNYQLSVEIDFGNGYVETALLTNANTSMILNFHNQYQIAGNYSIKLRVPRVDFQWELSQLKINGNKKKYIF